MTASTAEEQAQALAEASIYAFRKNLVVAASAGTGKTHALVGVAVHLLLGGCQDADGGLRPAIAPEGLVATTFSRKAAAEIRARLAHELMLLATGDPAAVYREGLLAAWAASGAGTLAGEDLAARAAQALARLSRAQIGTIHGLAGSIVRDHALAVGLSPDFEIADEETTRERATTAVSRVLERQAAGDEVRGRGDLAGGGEPLMSLACRLLSRLGEDGRMSADLAIASEDAAAVDTIVRTLLSHATDLATDQKLGGLARVVDDAHAGNDPQLFEDAVAAFVGARAAGKRSPSAEAFFEFRRSLPKAPNNTDRGRYLVRRWRVRDRMMPRAAALRALLALCEGEIAEANARDSILGFADVLRAARDLLRDHPDVAAEVAADLSALLVDEFQDTSAVQRDLVQLLWDQDPRGRAPGVVTPLGDIRGHGLLIVGDRKQSIYGFRGADVAVFAELCVGLAGLPAREALGMPPGLVSEPSVPRADFVALRHNRRAEPALLDFANAFSRRSLVPEARPAELYEIDYAPRTEDLRPPIMPDDGPRAARTRWLRPKVPEERRTTSPLQEAEVITARISCIVRGGEITVLGAPARWRDVAVLAQRHHMLDVTAYTLARAGIPHVVAGMGFYGAREVRDLASMLACLVDVDDSLARAEVLRGPWAGVTDRTLVGLTDPRVGLSDVGLWSVGERRPLIDTADREAVALVGAMIAALRPVVWQIGAGEALREAVRTLRFEETLVSLPRGEQRVANARKLVAMADGATDPRAFLIHLADAAEAEQREGEAATFSDEDDAVRLLTVHASKGLAFPIVFLPEAGAPGHQKGSDPALVHTGAFDKPNLLVLRVVDDHGIIHDSPSYADVRRDLARREAAERKRLRYVATTRASEAMFFVGDRLPPKHGSFDLSATLTSAILAGLAEDEAACASAGLEVETGESLLRTFAPTEVLEDPLPIAAPTLPPPSSIATRLRAEALLEAGHCGRLFQLVRRIGLSSDTPGSPMPPGDLKQALPWAGAWGRKLVSEHPMILYGQTMVWTAVGADDAPTIVVLGTADVVVAWADGSRDLLVMAREPAMPARYELYASVLGLALESTGGGGVRVGLMALTAPPMEDPHWMAKRDEMWTRLAVREAARRIASGSSSLELSPRADVTVCHGIRCSHLSGCYPPERAAGEAGERPAKLKQLTFEFAKGAGASPRRRRR